MDDIHGRAAVVRETSIAGEAEGKLDTSSVPRVVVTILTDRISLILRSGLADETAQAGMHRRMGRGRGGSAAKGDVRRKSMAHKLGWCEVSFGDGDAAWESYDVTRNRYGVLSGIR